MNLLALAKTLEQYCGKVFEMVLGSEGVIVRGAYMTERQYEMVLPGDNIECYTITFGERNWTERGKDGCRDAISLAVRDATRDTYLDRDF